MASWGASTHSKNKILAGMPCVTNAAQNWRKNTECHPSNENVITSFLAARTTASRKWRNVTTVKAHIGVLQTRRKTMNTIHVRMVVCIVCAHFYSVATRNTSRSGKEEQYWSCGWMRLPLCRWNSPAPRCGKDWRRMLCVICRICLIIMQDGQFLEMHNESPSIPWCCIRTSPSVWGRKSSLVMRCEISISRKSTIARP